MTAKRGDVAARAAEQPWMSPTAMMRSVTAFPLGFTPLFLSNPSPTIAQSLPE